MDRLLSLLPARLWRDRDGTALIEFAIAFPVMLLIYVATYTLTDAITCKRKVTIATRAITDLASRYATLSQSEAATILSASAQVMSPYSVNHAVVGMSEVQITDATHAIVIWSKALNAPGLTAGSTITVPANMAAPGTYLLLGQVRYTYTPAAWLGNVSTFTMSDSILMLPRVSTQVPLS